jgi:hypothetical protein
MRESVAASEIPGSAPARAAVAIWVMNAPPKIKAANFGMRLMGVLRLLVRNELDHCAIGA